MKISIIIPVFNGQACIGKCLDNVINQTYKDLEIIVINDGSTDDTIDHLTLYEKIDKRIIILHQENRGIYFTRRTGIEKAGGEAIFFVDADDYLEINAVEKLVLLMQERSADIVICNHMQVSKGKRQLIQNKIPVIQTRTNLLVSLLNNDIKGYCWGKLYRTSILKGLKQHDPINYGEDFLVNLLVFLNSQIRIELEEQPIYNYNIHPNSLISSKDKKMIEARYKYLEIAEKLLQEYNFGNHLKDPFSVYKCRNWIVYSRGGGALAKDKIYSAWFYRTNYRSYAKEHLKLYHKIEITAYRFNYNTGRVVSNAMRKMHAVFFKSL